MKPHIAFTIVLLLLLAANGVQASAPLSAIRTAEMMIRDQRVENMIVLDPDGTITLHSTGNYHSVGLNGAKVRLYGRTVIHNHHSGAIPYFSAKDIWFATFNNVKRTIVITPLESWLLGKVYIECSAERVGTIWDDSAFPIGLNANLSLKLPDLKKIEADAAQVGFHVYWTNYFKTRRGEYEYHCEVLP